jgi:Flp pilus assembly protein TadG
MTETSRARSARHRGTAIVRGTAFDRGDIADRDSGMVTVETALALCGFVAVLSLVLAGMAAMLAQIKCTDAAAEAARLVARGETPQAQRIVAEIAPGDAKISISATDDTVTVTVTADPFAGLLPGLNVRAVAVAVREPQPADDPAITTPAPAATPAPTTADPTGTGPTTAAAPSTTQPMTGGNP